MSARAIVGAIGVAVLAISFAEAQAKEVRVLATGAVQHTLEGLATRFKAETGHEVKMGFGTAGAVVGKFMAGDPVDLVFSSSGSLSAPAVRDKLAGEAPVVVGTVRIGLGVKAGAAAPDISSVEKLKAALLAAPAFAYADPASGATTGIHFAKSLAAMGIDDQVSGKAILRNGGLIVMKEVAEGRAAFGITQASEIKATPGVTFAAYLPTEVQLVSAYAGAVSKSAAEPDVARAFLGFVAGPEGRKAFEADGFDARP